MTVSELIRELQAMPNQNAAVKVLLSEVYVHDESGESHIWLCEHDAIEADEVRHEGAFVLVRSK